MNFYEDAVFGRSTFFNLICTGGPLFLINASDLSYGVRFSVVQEYFHLRPSDIISFRVARTVNDSLAVPVPLWKR